MNKNEIKNFISRIVEDVRNNDLSDKNLIDKYVREFIGAESVQQKNIIRRELTELTVSKIETTR